MDSVSGPNQPGMATIPNNPVFRASHHGGYLRNADAEYKLFERIAYNLNYNANASGSITIWTERAACPSCLQVKTQFEQMFPNIIVNIVDLGK